MTNLQSAPPVSPITARQLWFAALQQVEIREQVLPSLNIDELLVEVNCSAVSSGTEMLVYRGQIPATMTLDASLGSLQEQAMFPLQYGYACVGCVIDIGTNVNADWKGKLVFGFQPHASHFISIAANLIPVPDDIDPEAAVFLANMETAINLVQDGNPGLGERVVVLGQGIVGLLLSNLLSRFPLTHLSVLDGIAQRRVQALELGVQQALNPHSSSEVDALKQQLSRASSSGADLIYEVSGMPDALNLAIELSGFSSRIVIGSWYGNKSAVIALGGEAHRNRLNISTSQVSSLAPGLSGRWDKARRFDLVWDMIRSLQPQQLVTHRVDLADAGLLYERLHSAPDDIIQAIFVYSPSSNKQD